MLIVRFIRFFYYAKNVIVCETEEMSWMKQVMKLIHGNKKKKKKKKV